ncbi:MAG: spore maturation protein A [Ruminococcaceae bacterium]|nr:spore maturation protein A [Oscillospiraceae bacterium]
MLGKVFGAIVLVAVFFGFWNGTGEQMASAALDGAGRAIELTLTLSGMMCLWCGVMRVLEEAGVIGKLARLLRRPLAFFFPDAAARGEGLEEICANFAANLLGIGNAATPMALRALEKMQASNPDPDTATGDMITLTVLNTCSVALIPSTILALRRQAGATRPFEVVVPIWICSFVCATLGLLITRLLRGRVK